MKIKAILLLILSLFTYGCVGVAMIGAAGSMVAYDRRSFSMIEQDSRIFYSINRTIVNDRRFHGSRVKVTSFNEVVLLTGQVTSETLKSVAERVAQSTPNVRRVYNKLTVSMPLSVAQMSQDTYITGKVRSRLLMQKGLESGSIRIVTEDGDVYLLGIATHEQADLAVDAAKRVSGVMHVIKIFQYIM